jgi:hypothetical protein
MKTEFFGLQVSRNELQEIYRGLLSRHLMELAMRQEQGLEPIPYPVILERMEQVLAISEEEAHVLWHRLEGELWEFSWYSYTDEWAWFRARQDVFKQLGPQSKRIKHDALEDLIEKKYENNFEAYVAEIEIREPSETDAKRETKKKE